jgi:hypothetical protein
MASMMMCPAHGLVSGETCVPGCFEPLQPYIAHAAPASETCTAIGCGMPLPCPLHPAGDRDAGQREIAAHLVQPGPHGSAAAEFNGVALDFPWGRVAVPAQGLTVGRDFGEECGSEIEGFDNVSRRHAQITVEDGTAFVQDLDSTNGTTVNGIPTIARRPCPVTDGDLLGFGAHLRVSVRSGKTLP